MHVWLFLILDSLNLILDEFFFLESQNLLIVKDLFKLKIDLNFLDLIFNTQN